MTSAMLNKAQPVVRLVVAGGLSICPLYATYASGLEARWESLGPAATAPGYALNGQPVASLKDEIRRLQDELRSRSRLTRQQIAMAVGVDRRSLSAWASGESTPGPERLHALRFLATLAAEVEATYPGQTGSILEHRATDKGNALHAIADRRFSDARRLAFGIRSSSGDVTVEDSKQLHKPLYAAALKAIATGQLVTAAPSETRSMTVRPSAVYEMDPEEANVVPSEQREGPRRKDYE